MKILFLGYLVSNEDAGLLSGASIAGNKMQYNVVNNLAKIVESMEVLTIYPIATFPNDRKILIKKKRVCIGEEIWTTILSFVNIPLVKLFSQTVSMKREAKRYMKNNPDAIVITFNMYPQIGVTAKSLIKNGYRVIPLLADLPIEDLAGKNIFYRLYRYLYYSLTKRNIKEIDKVIVLNKNAAIQYAPDAKYMVIDGGVNTDEYLIPTERKNDNYPYDVVYCGNLSEYSGIKTLIEAMEFVDNRIRLNIYGTGELDEYIRTIESTNIVYHGKVDNKRMIEIQAKAWILINPRPVDDPVSMVTFPSKIFEYMMSGRPVVSTRLSGFSDEYNDLFIWSDSDKAEGLAKAIMAAFQMDSNKLEEYARAAYEFVVSKKTWEYQVKKIYDYISEN